MDRALLHRFTAAYHKARHRTEKIAGRIALGEVVEPGRGRFRRDQPFGYGIFGTAGKPQHVIGPRPVRDQDGDTAHRHLPQARLASDGRELTTDPTLALVVADAPTNGARDF